MNEEIKNRIKEINKLVNELTDLINVVDSIKLDLKRPLKKGDILIAISECLMDDNEESLTIGNEYPIISIEIDKNRICVIDDYNDKHFFMFHEIHDFFELKENLEISKI
jgi:hypothetical protein